MIRDLSPLRDSELFGQLEGEELELLAAIGSDFVAIEGALIFAEGRRAGHLYLVTSGRVALQKSVRAPHARRARRHTVTFCGPGEIIGWSALVEPHIYTLSAVAWESCRLVNMEGKLLRQTLDRHPDMGYKVMKALASVVHRRLDHTTVALIQEWDRGASRSAV